MSAVWNFENACPDSLLAGLIVWVLQKYWIPMHDHQHLLWTEVESNPSRSRQPRKHWMLTVLTGPLEGCWYV